MSEIWRPRLALLIGIAHRILIVSGPGGSSFRHSGPKDDSLTSAKCSSFRVNLLHKFRTLDIGSWHTGGRRVERRRVKVEEVEEAPQARGH